MVASHARKKDTIYRYYTSIPLMRGSKITVGSISRVSAPRIEGKIIEGLRSANITPPGTSDAKLLHAITKIILHAAEIELHLVDAHGSDRLIRIAADMRSVINTIRIIDAHGANQRSAPLIKALALAHS